MKPLGNRILLKPDPVDDQTEGGVHLPDTAKAVSDRGVVVAVGRGHITDEGKVIPPEVSPGDRVIFSARREKGIKLEGELHLVLPATKLVGILEPGDESNLEIVKK